MEFDYTGLVNQNEFYPDHYWHAHLPEKIKEFEKDWKQNSDVDQGRPWIKLKGHAAAYRTACMYFSSASPKERQEIHRALVRKLLWALGYDTRPEEEPIDRESSLPLFARVDSSGRPHLWVIEAVDTANTENDLLSLTPHGTENFRRLIYKAFSIDQPPRWILLTGLRSWVLFERDKWGAERMLRFNWNELFEQLPAIDTWKLITMLLSKPSLCPDWGDAWQDELQEQARQHAIGVSGSLKYALRESIELLGNEYLHYTRTVKGQSTHPSDLAERLTLECLHYMYRLLFLFNVEARHQELGYLPMKATAYRDGYSLEKLRDLEMVPLSENGSADGSFFHQSMMMLFDLVFNGYDDETGVQQEFEYDADTRTFRIAPLQCDLFDSKKPPLLNAITIRDRCWQRIIRMMSLGHEDFQKKSKQRSRRRGRGRISYRHLSVNHLGSVYEALLSYRGFIAKEDLYEVKPAGESPDVLDPAYLVSRDALDTHYDREERVMHKDGTLRMHPKGSFIYRLTGRAREESASYYTPESLTQCVTAFALKDVLKDKSAGEILEITLCEPAMGSAAFLNEAVSQLAEAYLTRKTRELDEVLDPDRWTQELQRVKMYLADNNVYGIDLNPVAVELGGISIWLNTLVPGGFVPWFGNQLKCGNSLVGAWRKIYTRAQLAKGKWWNTDPEDVALTDPRPSASVYHFLVGDAGMAQYKDKVVRQLASEALKQITAWRKRFTAKPTDSELNQLVYFSSLIDQLWREHIRDLIRLEHETTDTFAIYPKSSNQDVVRSSTRGKEQKYRQILEPEHGNASAYQRLKLVMDYWCALWYWPIDQSQLLPTRTEYLGDLAQLLAGKAEVQSYDLFGGRDPARDALGFVDLSALIHARPRLQVVQHLTLRYRFHHWQLEYADQFAEKGGFDVVLGNPPWRKPNFVEQHVIGDTEPRFVTRDFDASQTAKARPAWLDQAGRRTHYIEAYEVVGAQLAFLKAKQNYPLLKGLRTNLYKAFICVSWAISTNAVGFLHPNSVYDEARGQALREALYPRLRYRLQFENALNLFDDNDHGNKFSINIYGQPREDIRFTSMANLYHPITATKSMLHDGYGPVPGIKTSDNQWELAAHRNRMIDTSETDLQTYALLYDPPGTPPGQARLPLLHAQELARLLRKLAQTPRRIRDLGERYSVTQMWNETNAKKDGTIRQKTRFTTDVREWILSGPHFFVGTPFFQTPNAGCKSNRDYTRLDLTTLPEDYRPRANYVPACGEAEYARRTPQTPWGTLVTKEFRVGMREMLGPGSERTLIPALVPPGVGHIHSVITVATQRREHLLSLLYSLLSIVTDTVVKIGGTGHIKQELLESLPLTPASPAAVARILGLSCLSIDYSTIWNACASNTSLTHWSKTDPRLNSDWFDRRHEPWSWHSPLRADYARRQALLEIDVLHAQALGVTLTELLALYRTQFPILQSYENDTWYDTKGRIVFSKKSGQSPVPRTRTNKKNTFGLHTPGRAQTNLALGWNDIKDLQEGVVTYTYMDDTLPGGPRERTIEFHAPFDKCDRENDYREAWAFFERAKANGEL